MTLLPTYLRMWLWPAMLMLRHTLRAALLACGAVDVTTQIWLWNTARAEEYYGVLQETMSYIDHFTSSHPLCSRLGMTLAQQQSLLGTKMTRQSLRILLIGNGGREHSLAWKLSQSEKVESIHVAPGNGGTAG